MPIHDQTATVVNLAKAMRRDLDRMALNTSVQTATLELLLNSLIELGEPDAPVMSQQRARTVAEMVHQFKGE